MSETESYLAAIEARMRSGVPFTYGMLCQIEPRPDGEVGRTADKTIQKWRRKGWIALTREGRKSVWRLTETYPHPQP